MPHPLIDTARSEIAGARQLLTTPCPEADRTYLLMQADRFYAEQQQKAILEWLPKLDDYLETVGKALEDKEARVAELEAENAKLKGEKAEGVIDAVAAEISKPTALSDRKRA